MINANHLNPVLRGICNGLFIRGNCLHFYMSCLLIIMDGSFSGSCLDYDVFMPSSLYLVPDFRIGYSFFITLSICISMYPFFQMSQIHRNTCILKSLYRDLESCRGTQPIGQHTSCCIEYWTRFWERIHIKVLQNITIQKP